VRTILDKLYEGNAKNLMRQLTEGLASWANGLQAYRHGQAVEEPFPPPLEAAVAALQTGGGYVRLLVELDKSKTVLDELFGLKSCIRKTRGSLMILVRLAVITARNIPQEWRSTKMIMGRAEVSPLGCSESDNYHNLVMYGKIYLKYKSKVTRKNLLLRKMCWSTLQT
jgi:hypothetical protein